MFVQRIIDHDGDPNHPESDVLIAGYLVGPHTKEITSVDDPDLSPGEEQGWRRIVGDWLRFVGGRWVIEIPEGGEFEEWRSSMRPEIDPAVRLNFDAGSPSAFDARTGTPDVEIPFRVATVKEAAELGWDEDTHRVVAALAAVVEAVTVEAAAKACGLSEQAITDEAKAWEAATGFTDPEAARL
ncbi:MAG: hypothetical protein SHS37scaffold145_11 [Phage 71_18]|nr:MAG: hypothetical protein SHS37scaffold145_11 [Phage 71_18]